MTSARIAPLAAAAAALALPSAASAADQLLVDKLAPEIADRCVGSRISAAALRDAIDASKIAPLAYQSAWRTNPTESIARAAFADDTGPNRNSLDILQHLAITWLDPSLENADAHLPLASGGVEASLRRGGEPQPDQAEDMLRAILNGDDSRFQFVCSRTAARAPAPAEQPAAGPSWRLSVVRDPGDLSVPDLADKTYAEFAYLNDEVADEKSYSVYATAGLIGPRMTKAWGTVESPRGRLFIEASPVVFLQVEREGSEQTPDDEEVNNLNLGLQLGGFIQTRRTRTLSHYYAISARFMSDDELDSEAWAVNAEFVPHIPLPGNDVPYGDRFTFRWLVTLAADYMSIDDVGQKAALREAREYARIGYNLDGQLRYEVGEQSAFALKAGYAVRDDLDGKSDAQFFVGQFLFEPGPNLAFGVAYERGENLDTLEFSHKWKLTVGVRY